MHAERLRRGTWHLDQVRVNGGSNRADVGEVRLQSSDGFPPVTCEASSLWGQLGAERRARALDCPSSV